MLDLTLGQGFVEEDANGVRASRRLFGALVQSRVRQIGSHVA